MQINVFVADSVKITQQENIRKILVDVYSISFMIKFLSLPFGDVTKNIKFTSYTKNLKLNGFLMKSRLLITQKRKNCNVFFNYVEN